MIGNSDTFAYTPLEYACAETHPVWFLVLLQAKWSSLDEDDFVSFLQILDALLEVLSFVVIRFRLQTHPITVIESQHFIGVLDVNYGPCKSFWTASEVRQEWYLLRWWRRFASFHSFIGCILVSFRSSIPNTWTSLLVAFQHLGDTVQAKDVATDLYRCLLISYFNKVSLRTQKTNRTHVTRYSSVQFVRYHREFAATLPATFYTKHLLHQKPEAKPKNRVPFFSQKLATLLQIYTGNLTSNLLHQTLITPKTFSKTQK